MGKGKKILHFRSIRSKIIFAIYLVMFPVLIVTGVSMHIRTSQGIEEDYTNQYQTAVDVLNDTIGYFEKDLQDIFTYVIVNHDVEQVLRSPESLGADNPLFWRSLSPMNFVNGMLNVKGNIRTFILYPENGLVPFYNSQDGSVMVKEIDDIRKLDVYDRAVAALGDTVWERVDVGSSGFYEKNKYDKIVLAREIFDGSKQTKLGFIALSVDVSQYEEICNNSLLDPNDGIVIVDGQYREIARVGTVEDDLINDLARTRYPEQEDTFVKGLEPVQGYYVFAAPRGTDGWIFYLSPKSTWDARRNAGLVIPIVLGAALFVCILPLSLFASRMISRPLGSLYRSMNRFREGDFSQQVQVSGEDEIAELSITFNQMVQDMKEMIDRNYVMALREKESELNALQAQINPHFLYNALDSLYWQATDASQEELAENILSLSTLFRLLLSSGQSEISVKQEVELVTHYLHIQKMRFAKKLDYTISVPEEMMSYSISKLILQPFVENAIVHGLERMDSWGYVRVNGELKDGMLHFMIEDNGIGMSMEKVDEILFANEDKRYANQRIGHYAIRNVKERMFLRYGDQASLDIHSNLGTGTRVNILIPASRKISVL